MEQKSKKISRAVMATALGIGAISVASHAIAKSNCPVEKCYGIVKKAKNDCGTPKHACAAEAKTSGDKNEWIFVMKGNCERIVGGSLKASNVAAVAPASTTTTVTQTKK